ncbi:MAG: AAA family ATPase [Actinomycetota bacterium]
MTILVEANQETAGYLRSALGPGTTVEGITSLRRTLEHAPEDVIVFGPETDFDAACEFAAAERVANPTRGVVLVRRRVDTAVLAQAMRAGIREVVSADNLQQVNEACRAVASVSNELRAAQRLPGVVDPGAGAGQVITVFSAKGGSGKTTISTNLGAALNLQGSKVCVVDIDLGFGDVAISMQLFPTRTVADAVALTHLDQTAVQSLVTRYRDQLDTILAPVEPGMSESIPGQTIVGLLRVLKTMYDYVVIDTPPAFTEHVLSALDETDWLLLLATLDVPALKNLKLALETLDILNYPESQRLLVLNRADSQVGLNMGDVLKILGTPIALEVPSSRAVPASINRGVPLVYDQPNHPVSQAIRRFAKAQFPRGLAPAIAGHGRRGFALHRKGGAA